MKYTWLWWSKEDVRTERRQALEEGRDVHAVEAEFARLLADETIEDAAYQDAVDALLDQTAELPWVDGRPYDEPSELDAIRERRPAGTGHAIRSLGDDAKRDHLAGAWLGRCIGCLLGKPIEGVHRPKLRALLERSGCDEIPDYLWRLPGLSDADYAELGFASLPGWRGTCHMPADDDTNYTVAALALVQYHGFGFAPDDVIDHWLWYLPARRVCTAERVAYRNALNRITPPRTATVRNPYREWIGAQIRADFYGYVALGDPARAAELAWRDASISHTRNGIYGAMWVAAMLAVAAGETDVRAVIEAGLLQIPGASRLTEGVRDVLGWHAEGVPYAAAVDAIHRRWDETVPHAWCHTVANAQVVAVGLLYGEGDFGRAVSRAVGACFDTDCNGATVGSVMGMILGREALPHRWTDVLHDTLHTSLPEHPVRAISELAEETYRLHLAAQTSR